MLEPSPFERSASTLEYFLDELPDASRVEGAHDRETFPSSGQDSLGMAAVEFRTGG
jgi:hypothetical protein